MAPAPTTHKSDTDIPGLHSSDRISLTIPKHGEEGRPAPVKYMSTPAYHSPLRHHKRAASSTRHVKETLNARSEYSNSEDDGTAQHRINQYLIKQEIGRGSFGAVHLAVDQYGHEYAVKEFSKSRLRKRVQSNLLRRPSARRRRQGALSSRLAFNSPLHRHSSSDENNSLDLIKEEIAIMKKLNHPNLVSLIEVLDDPMEDSLYMVMEMCKKGVVMQVGLEERADPYTEQQCRCWFRDMILGIEYLHAQGIIHRDIKPDNCLVTEEDVLKIVDFGVSEMFDKPDEMKTAKSAGSPAFMPPELCVPKHGHVSGRAADIWSMGVTLYCLLFGRIPFEKFGMLELYQAIREESLEIDTPVGEELRDILMRLLEKDPEKRITMDQLREHPWVTMHGKDPLLSKDENVAIIVEPTDEEVDMAITGSMGHLVTVVRAVKRFKQLLFRRRPERMESILGSSSRIVQPPLPIRPSALRKSKSQDTDDRHPIEGALTSEGIHREIEINDNLFKATDSTLAPKVENATPTSIASDRPALDVLPPKSPEPLPLAEGLKSVHDNMSTRPSPPKMSPISIPSRAANSTPTTPIGKGHAHDPLEDTLILHIGTGEDYRPPTSGTHYVVSESPSNTDINVYEAAYQEEITRIMASTINSKDKSGGAEGGASEKDKSGGAEGGGEKDKPPRRRPTLYLTRRVENTTSLRDKDLIVDSGRTRSELKSNIKNVLKKAQKSVDERAEMQRAEGREDWMSRGWRGLKEVKDKVDEAREIVREEERRGGKRPGEWEGMYGCWKENKEGERERNRSAASTPRRGSATSTPRRGSAAGSAAGGSATPVGVGVVSVGK